MWFVRHSLCCVWLGTFFFVALLSGPSNWPNPKCSGLINKCARNVHPNGKTIEWQIWWQKWNIYSNNIHAWNTRQTTEKRKKTDNKTNKTKTRTIRLRKGSEKVRRKEPTIKFQDRFAVIVSKRKQLRTADDFTFFELKIHRFTGEHTFTCGSWRNVLILESFEAMRYLGARKVSRTKQRKIIPYALPLKLFEFIALHFIWSNAYKWHDHIDEMPQPVSAVWLRPDKLDPDGNVHWFLLAFKSSTISWANLCVVLSLFTFFFFFFFFLFDDEKGSHQNRFVLVGKKSDDFVFSSFLYLRLVQLQSNKYIVTQRLRRSNAAGCMHRANQTEVTTILGKKIERKQHERMKLREQKRYCKRSHTTNQHQLSSIQHCCAINALETLLLYPFFLTIFVIIVCTACEFLCRCLGNIFKSMNKEAFLVSIALRFEIVFFSLVRSLARFICWHFCFSI